MKKVNFLNSILLILNLVFFTVNSDAQVLPDIFVEPTSSSHYYYENKGQVIDDSNNVRNDVLFYTVRTQPAVYLFNNKASFVLSQLDTTSTDTQAVVDTYRIDFEFPHIAESVSASEQSRDSLNFYLRQCDTGITGVRGFERVVYTDVFQNIDFHFYSNNMGTKSYIVIYPGGNPNEITFKFSGQDSMQILDSNVIVYLSPGYSFSLPQATAYQIDSNGNPVSVNWDPTWLNNGGGNIGLSVSTYNTNLPLIIRIAGFDMGSVMRTNSGTDKLIWSTYFGGNATDRIEDILATEKDNLKAELYITGHVAESTFPLKNGYQKKYGEGAFDGFVTRFNYESVIVWSTFYGGRGAEKPTKITDSPQEVFIIGTVEEVNFNGSYDNLLLKNRSGGSGYYQPHYGGGYSDAFIASYNKAQGTMLWSTYFGGNGAENGNSIRYVWDNTNHQDIIYIAGSTSTTNIASTCSAPTTVGEFPICTHGGMYNQNFNNGDLDGFIAEFAGLDFPLVWSTLFGGNGTDEIRDINLRINPEVIAICGITNSTQMPDQITTPFSATSGKFPLAGSIPGDFVQNTPSGMDGFISKFSSGLLVWSSLIGGEGTDGLTSVALNSEGEIISTGFTTTSTSQASCSALTNGKIPICDGNNPSTTFTQGTFGGGSDLLIVGFNASDELNWSTYYGGTPEEVSPNNWLTEKACIYIDDDNNIYVAGNAKCPNSFSGTELETTNIFNLYFQDHNSDYTKTIAYADGFLLCFNQEKSRKWATFFGGGVKNNVGGIFADEVIRGVDAMLGSVFVGGYTNNSFKTLPYKCPTIGPSGSNPYCENKLLGQVNGFITRFDLGRFPLGNIKTSKDENNFIVYPNITKTNLTIEIPITTTGEVVFHVYDINGKLLSNYIFHGQIGIDSFNINVSDFTAGMYLITAQSATATYVAKFIKE